MKYNQVFFSKISIFLFYENNTYAGKGELESNQLVVDIEFKAKYWDLTWLSLEERDQRVILELVARSP